MALGLYYKTYYDRTDFRNKLECLSLASLLCLSLCSWVRLGAYPRVELLKVLHSGRLWHYLQTID